jgi:hypothetical protein
MTPFEQMGTTAFNYNYKNVYVYVHVKRSIHLFIRYLSVHLSVIGPLSIIYPSLYYFSSVTLHYLYSRAAGSLLFSQDLQQCLACGGIYK